MTDVMKKVKDKLKDAKDTVVGSEDDTEGRGYDSTKKYESNEPNSDT
jgi:hypothetical protein